MRSWWRTPLLAATAVVTTFAVELAVWAELDLSASVLWVSRAALVAAVLAALLGGLLRLRLGETTAVSVPTTMAAAVAVIYFLRLQIQLPRGLNGLVGSAAGIFLGAALSAAIVALARRRLGLLVAVVPVAAAAIGALLPHAESAAVTMRRGPDVVLIVLDTTRRDHLSLYGYSRNTSPALDSLARDAAVYDDAWSVAPWTPSSHASLFTGLLPAEHGVDGEDPPAFPAGIPTLATTFRSAGYRTGGFVANPNLAAPGWNRGFDRYDTPWIRGRHSLVGLSNKWFIHAQDAWSWDARNVSARTFDLARAWWEENTRGTRFLFVNLIDSHRPYNPPGEVLRQFLPGVDPRDAYAVEQDPDAYTIHPGLGERQAQMLRGLYDGEIATMDRGIGQFLGWLGRRGELDKTIVAVVADHGERLGERGLVGHEALATNCMDSFLLHVPLIVRYPPAVLAGRVSRRVQTYHLGGHLLRLAGVAGRAPGLTEDRLASEDAPVTVAQFKNPEWILDRLKSRLPADDLERRRGDRVLVADRHFTLISKVDSSVHPELLIDTTTDPGWTRNLLDAEPGVVARLVEVSIRLPRFGTSTSATSAPDPITLEELRSLGYVRQ